MLGILSYNKTTGEDEDTDIRRLLIEMLSRKDELFSDELAFINTLEITYRRLTRYEANRLIAIHGRLPREI